MSDRLRFGAVSARTIFFAWLLAGCGSYNNDSDKGTGGTSGTATGGTSGTATGGTSGTATGGTSGTATGGTSGTATGGTSGQGGSGGSGAPTGGAAGSGTGGGGSGAGGQAACTGVAPCGGDVIGAWTVNSCQLSVTGMADLGLAGLGCTMAPVMGSLTVSGTWTAAAGGMYTDNTTMTGQLVHELAAACLNVSGFTTECDRVVLDSIGLPSPEPPAVQCVENTATGGCTCTTTINQQGGLGVVGIGAPTSGSFTTATNKLTLSAAGVDTVYSYCVAGNTMTVTLDTATGASPTTSPIVFQK